MLEWSEVGDFGAGHLVHARHYNER